VCPLPPPNGAKREERGDHNERGADDQRRRGKREEKAAKPCKQKGAKQRRNKHDSVTPGVEIDTLAGLCTHARGFATRQPDPAGVSADPDQGMNSP